MRHCSRLFLLVLLCALLVLPAQALTHDPEPEPDPETSAQPVVLTEVFINTGKAHWPYVEQVLVAEPGAPLDLSALPAEGTYLDADGGKHQVPLLWDTQDPALQTPGYHTLTARPVLPEQMSLAQGFDGVITWPVFRKGDGAVLEVSPLQDHYISDNMIAQGSADPLSELSISTKGRRWAVGETGFILSTPEWVWEWDGSQIDTSTPGQTSVTGTLVTLPDWISVPQAARTVTHPVYVLPTDGIDLSAPNLGVIQNAIQFQWLYDCSAVTEAILEYQKDGTWLPCESTWYRYASPTYVSGAKLLLYPPEMPAGSYTLRLRYTDETSGQPVERFTDTLSLTVPANAAELMAGTPKPEDFGLGGDRDGGDSGGTQLPSFQQTAPGQNGSSGSSGKTAASSTATEEVTDTSTTLSGLRLAQLTAQGETVLFAHQGVSLEIPSPLLTDLGLAPSDLLTVSLIQPQEGAVRISVTARGEEVTDLTGSVLWIPYSLADGQTLTCKDQRNHPLSVTYDEDSSTARVVIDQPGTYLLTLPDPDPPPEETPDEVPPQAQTTLLPALLLVIGLLAAAGLLLRRWRHG